MTKVSKALIILPGNRTNKINFPLSLRVFKCILWWRIIVYFWKSCVAERKANRCNDTDADEAPVMDSCSKWRLKGWTTALDQHKCDTPTLPNCTHVSNCATITVQHLCCGNHSNASLSLCRMLWRITVPVILAGVLFITAETKKPRPQGSIPSPNKTKGNLSSARHHRLLQQKPEVLSSSREALVVTERRYLRRDWCKTQPLRQTISEEGCRSLTVVNRFCYGQCNSFYIPRHMGPSSAQAQSRGQAPGSRRKSHNKAPEPFQSCSFCRPHRITQLTVQLDCPDLQPPFKHRKVQRVKQCRCMSVDVGGHGKLWRADRKQVKINLQPWIHDRLATMLPTRQCWKRWIQVAV